MTDPEAAARAAADRLNQLAADRRAIVSRFPDYSIGLNPTHLNEALRIYREWQGGTYKGNPAEVIGHLQHLLRDIPGDDKLGALGLIDPSIGRVDGAAVREAIERNIGPNREAYVRHAYSLLKEDGKAGGFDGNRVFKGLEEQLKAMGRDFTFLEPGSGRDNDTIRADLETRAQRHTEEHGAAIRRMDEAMRHLKEKANKDLPRDVSPAPEGETKPLPSGIGGQVNEHAPRAQGR